MKTFLLSPTLLPSIAALALLGASACGDDASSDDAADSGSSGAASTRSTAPGTTTTAGSSSGDITDPDSGSTAAASSSEGGSTDDTSADESSTGVAGLEIEGSWFEDFGGGSGIDHEIDELSWMQSSRFGISLYHVESYDNEGRWLVAQGDIGNEFFPELYNKFNWFWDGDELYYCTAVFDAATAEDAEASPDADPGDLAAGCGGFSWSLLQPTP